MLTINQLSIQKYTLNNQGLPPPYTDYQAVTSLSKSKRYIKSGLEAALGAEDMSNGHFDKLNVRKKHISITPKRGG